MRTNMADTYPTFIANGPGKYLLVTASGRYPFTLDDAKALLDTKATEILECSGDVSIYLAAAADIIIVNDNNKLWAAYRTFFEQFLIRRRSDLALRPMDEADLPWQEARR